MKISIYNNNYVQIQQNLSTAIIRSGKVLLMIHTLYFDYACLYIALISYTYFTIYIPLSDIFIIFLLIYTNQLFYHIVLPLTENCISNALSLSISASFFANISPCSANISPCSANFSPCSANFSSFSANFSSFSAT